ncbi:phospholipase A2 inhibitor and Ly6/PLAUR domain-containing protein-like [Cervus elaphus]|uniref:phospholipase A2 inhibitor and Ly6/PLAUR domain-containing protein-like n=1 Tax=Cervus elaphus TaxID=9860 RepID=UPI001CC2BAE2|nr:phospholipase A2 inhibitor and Ly6/PLAUR domain-containing protein-like [Cervus elaphus]XP_043755298.1 phospholipase A2 inhibitor and Ly6/PLAUR domain-containing protein-like [Cervus elaphus]
MTPSTKPETFLLTSMLLCTLLGLGYPLSCEVCIRNGAKCTGVMKTCAQDEDSCISVMTETNNKGSVDVTSYKGCAKSSECDPEFLSITVAPENYMGSDTRCCQTDGCNHKPLPAIVRNHTENGLRCPSCITAFSETCTSTQEAVCVGEETHCVAVSGLAQPGIRFAARGCGTEAACHSKPGTLVPSGSRLLTIKKTSCRPSPQASGKAE